MSGTIIVNGEEKPLTCEVSLADLLAELGIDSRRVAVELDREVVPRDGWKETTVSPGASLEIVEFVGGG